MKGYDTSFTARVSFFVDRKRCGQNWRWSENTALRCCGSQIRFQYRRAVSERISALPAPSPRKRHSGEVFLFSGARITHGGHRISGVSQLAGHGDPLLRATSWPKPSRTNDSLNFIALALIPVAPSRFFNLFRFYFASRNSSRFFPVAFAACSCKPKSYTPSLVDVRLSCT